MSRATEGFSATTRRMAAGPNPAVAAGWGFHLPGTPCWLDLAAADTDAAVARVVELAGEMRHPPFDAPFGRMAIVSDPTGAVFTILKPSQLALES